MSAKNLDQQGRFRSKVIAFRISPEENEVLERKVALSGMTKQDYLIKCVLDKDIIVEDSPYVIRSLQNELREFISKFGLDITTDDTEVIKMALKIVIGKLD